MLQQAGASHFQRQAESELAFLKGHIYQQLVAFNIHYVAESAVAASSEIKAHAAGADAKVPHTQVIEKFGQSWIHDVEFLALCAGPDAKHRHQDQENGP